MGAREPPVPLATIPGVLSAENTTEAIRDAEQTRADLHDRQETLAGTARTLRFNGQMRLAAYVGGLLAEVEQRLAATEDRLADLVATSATAAVA